MAAIFRRRVRRGYRARLQVKDSFDKHINPLHLTVLKRVAERIQKDKDDDIFVCALRVRRHEKWLSSADDNLDLDVTPKDCSQAAAFSVSSAFRSAEDIAVCVWSEVETSETNTNAPTKEYVDDVTGDNGLTLFCTVMFLEHYNLSVCDDVYIRALRVYPITRAIFTVSDVQAYEWLQKEKFSFGLITEICKHSILVVQNDVLLAPYPTTFLDDPFFQRGWFHKMKAIACAPFMMGLMSVNTEIIVCYEEEAERLSYDHGHLSTSNLDKYVAGGLFVSDFCRSLSSEETDGVFHDVDKMTFNACVIQQERNWHIVLSSTDDIDMNTIIGIPDKLMRHHGLFDGSLIKVSLVDKNAEIQSPSASGDANSTTIASKEKYVRVKCLSRQLDNTNIVFISSLLLFNLQSGPPINMAPVIRAEKSTHVVEANMDGEYRPSSMSRSLVDNIQMATEMHVAIVNSPSYNPMCRYAEALKKHFQTPRLLNVGDIIAVRSSDDPEFWQDAKLDTGLRKPVMFFKVIYMFPRQPALYPCYVSYDITNVSQIGSVHSHVPLGADRYLSLHNTTYGQGITCPGLDKHIVDLEALVLPHIRRKIDGVHMLEMLPSILLSGSEGIGKTTIVETVARRLYIQVQQVNCHDLCGDTARSVETKMKATFLAAALYAPCILLLKNIDVIGKEKDGTTEDPRVISSFYSNITELVTQIKQFPVVVVATTHSLSDLSEDMHQCFLHELKMEAPTEMERGEIIHGLLEGETVSADVSVSHIAQRTAGFVLGDLIVLMQITKREAYSKALKICQPGSQRLSMEDEEDLALAGVIIEQSDFEEALNVMQSTHSDAIGAPKIPSVQWSDVGGLANIKTDILDTIQLPLQHPELLAAGLRRSGVLLYGPPGTGKTLLAKAVATECSLNFLSVKGPELINMYVGQSEANVREVFKRARSASPCVIFFDELDSLAPNRGRSGDSGGVMDRVVSQLLAELDGLHKSHDVFVIGATNRPDLLDPALLRPGRFDKLLYLGVAEDRESQLNILTAVTRKFKLEEGLKLSKVVEKCPWNMTGADFYALCADAMLNAVKQKIEMLEKGQEVDQTDIAVAEKDFDLALQMLTPSVSLQELERYKEIRSKFAST